MSAEHFDEVYDNPVKGLLPNGSVAVPQGSALDPSVARPIQQAKPWDGGIAQMAQGRRQQFRESLRLELSDRLSYLRRQRQDFEASVKIVQAQVDRLQLLLDDLGL